MKFSSINISYDMNDEIESYIVSFTSRKEESSLDGQIRISADEANLSNIIEVAKMKITDVVNEEQPI